MNFKKIAVIGFVIASSIAISACGPSTTTQGTSQQNSSVQEQSNSSQNVQAAEEVTITFSDEGVSPSPVKVKAGGSIKWVNNSSAKIQIGSDPHPTHTTNAQITGSQFVIELAPGQSSDSVKVTKTGTWGYHDHLNPVVRGKVVVE